MDQAAEFEADTTIEKAPNHYSKGCRVLIENGDLDSHVPTVSPWLCGSSVCQLCP